MTYKNIKDFQASSTIAKTGKKEEPIKAMRKYYVPSKKNRKKTIQFSSLSFFPFPDLAYDAQTWHGILQNRTVNVFWDAKFGCRRGYEVRGSWFKSRCQL